VTKTNENNNVNSAIETMFHWRNEFLHLQLFVWGLISYLRYLYLVANSGVQHILCCVFDLFYLCSSYVPYGHHDIITAVRVLIYCSTYSDVVYTYYLFLRTCQRSSTLSLLFTVHVYVFILFCLNLYGLPLPLTLFFSKLFLSIDI
jgi:hypothetical protein